MAERSETRQLTIDDCAALSRRISELFDEVDPIEEAYRLEVSSPGIDRPLTRLQDFEDWKGHAARIALKQQQDGRKQLTGEAKGTEGGLIVGHVNVNGALKAAFDDVQDAQLTMTDKLIKRTGGG